MRRISDSVFPRHDCRCRRLCIGWVNSMLATWIWISLLCIPLSAASAEEKMLYEDIFRDYIPDVRPRLNFHETVTIKIDFEVNQIKDLNEQNQILYTVGFLQAEWDDDYLKWNPENYSGIHEFIVPPRKVWLPDFGIQNSAGSFYQDDFFDHFRVHVNYTGRITWAFGGLFDTTCEIDTVLFPFDIQSCPFILENWAYTNNSVNLVNGSAGIQLDTYHSNGIWHLIYHEVELDSIAYSMNPQESYPQVRFILHMQRKPRYYLVNIVLPCIFLTSIALLVFWLPPESGEKVSLGVTILLSFSVFQLVIASSTPENSDSTPLLSVFVSLTMALSTVSVVTTVLVLYLHHKAANYPVPNWLRFVALDILPRILCIQHTTGKHQSRVRKRRNTESNISSLLQKIPDEEFMEMNILEKNSGNDGFPTALRSLASQVDQVTAQLKLLTSRLLLREEEEEVIEEWQAVAKVLDRLLFWIALFVLVGSLIWLMYMSFHVKHNFDVE